MAEWLKAPVLKTGDAGMHRGFESYSLRHIMQAYAGETVRTLAAQGNRAL